MNYSKVIKLAGLFKKASEEARIARAFEIFKARYKALEKLKSEDPETYQKYYTDVGLDQDPELVSDAAKFDSYDFENAGVENFLSNLLSNVSDEDVKTLLKGSFIANSDAGDVGALMYALELACEGIDHGLAEV